MPDVYSTEVLPHLLTRWGRGEITVEQLAGYLLQHVIRHDQRLLQLEKAQGRTQTGPPPSGAATQRVLIWAS